MACYHPLTAYQDVNGSVSFAELRGDFIRTLQLPCGRCIGCLQHRVLQWELRCTHEARVHDCNIFVTLTYDEKHVPFGHTLVPDDFRLFIKRVRHHYPERKVRFFGCGEYGEKRGRPHYHVILFGHDFEGRYKYRKTHSGKDQYTSPILDRLWPYGLATFCDFEPDLAGYIARYVIDRSQSWAAKIGYEVLDTDTGEIVHLAKEFLRMSRRPGIGGTYLEKFSEDALKNNGTVVHKGKEVRQPRYYDKKLKKDIRMDDAEWHRFKQSRKAIQHQTPERLATRETVALLNQKARRRHKGEFQ